MNYELVALIVSLAVLVYFILYTLIYSKSLHHSVQVGLEIEVEDLGDVESLEDHFKEEEMAEVREKIAAIDALMPEKSTKTVEEGPLTIKKDEQLLIDEGKRMYEEFQEELRSVEPETPEQHEQDLMDLKQTIKHLELMDPEKYLIETDGAESLDMGKGMLYDSISQRLKKIIKENQWDKQIFVQAEKLETQAFEKIKHLEHPDFMETLKVMQEIGMISNLIEIDPQTNLLLFKKESFPLNSPHKVIISLLSDNPEITLDDIKKRTNWSGTYLNENLEYLEEKGILKRDNQEITIEGMISLEEKRKLQQKLIKVEQKRIEKAKGAQKLQEEKKAKEKELEEQKHQEEQKILLERTKQEATAKSEKIKEQLQAKEKSSKKAKTKGEQSQQDITPSKEEKREESSEPKDDLADLESLVHEVENLEEISKNTALESLSNDQQDKTSESVISDDYQEEIMAVLQVFQEIEEMTGGMVILQALLWYMNEGGYPDMKKMELMLVLDSMKAQHLIYKDYTYSGVNIYIYKDLPITSDLEELIRQFVIYGEMDIEDIQTAVEWEETRLNQALHALWNLNLMKMNEKEKYYLPGLFNTQ